MSKKMMKRSLALGALMAFVITGSAMAAEAVENNATGAHAIAIGENAVSNENCGVAIGYKAQSAMSATAVGNEAKAVSSASAYGTSSNASGAGSVAVGSSSNATGTGGIAIGMSSNSAGGIAVGVHSDANNSNSIAIGTSTVAGKDGISGADAAIAMGDRAVSNYHGDIAIGFLAEANSNRNGYSATAIGREAKALAECAVAVGKNAQALNNRATALGHNAVANSVGDLALGAEAATNFVTSVNNVTIGGKQYDFAGGDGETSNYIAAASFGGTTTSSAFGASSSAPKTIYRQLQNVAAGQVTAESTDAVNGSQLNAAYKAIDDLNNTKVDKNNNTVVIGAGATAVGDSGVAVGRLTNAAGGSVAVGVSSVASGGLSVAMGYGSEAQGENSVAIGRDTTANGANSVVMGINSAVGENAVAIGSGLTASGERGIAIGSGSTANGFNGIAIGFETNSAETGSVAIGLRSNATDESTTAIGYGAEATGNRASAYGANAKAVGLRSTALGYSAKANNDFDVALGSHSETKQVVNVSSVEIGGKTYEFAGSEATGAVSFGGGGSSSLGVSDIKRQLQNVAAGQVTAESTDAVNGSQLHAAYQAIDKIVTEKADVTYVDEQLELKANAADVYTKEEADKEFLNQEEADARYVQIGADVIENEDGSTTAKTEISDNFVVEETTTTTATGTSTSTKVTINEGDKAQLVVGGGEQNDKIVFGQHSSWYSDQKGFFFGGGNGVHDDAAANAYIKEDGTIMGAKGKFKVDEEGNVTGGTYNGIDIVGMNQRLDRTNAKINKVGAGAAALAALHPLEYDPDDKLTFSAGMGNYAGENAAALGAFYRPNEKFMVSLGGTMGNGENMVNLGLSIGLDKASGLAKLSKRELIQKVNAVEAENDALEDRVAKLEALVAQLANK